MFGNAIITDVRNLMSLTTVDNANLRVGIMDMPSTGQMSDLEVFFDNVVVRTVP